MLTQSQEERLFADFLEVGRAFSFLERFGYELAEAYPFSLDYRSDRGFVVVWLNPQPGHGCTTWTCWLALCGWRPMRAGS